MSTVDPLDVLAIVAHPDDAELGCGGTLARLARLGRRVGVLDLTRGELGSRGTPELRATEADAAGRALGLHARRNAELPDGGLLPHDDGHRLAVIRVLRELRPRLVIAPWLEVRHPDHAHAARLAEEATFRAGLFKIDTGQEPHRPARMLYYMEQIPFEPTLVVDISDDFERKMSAIQAYRSQFVVDGDDDQPATFIAQPEFLASIESRSRFYGSLIGVAHGEPFLSRGPLPAHDLTLFA